MGAFFVAHPVSSAEMSAVESKIFIVCCLTIQLVIAATVKKLRRSAFAGKAYGCQALGGRCGVGYSPGRTAESGKMRNFGRKIVIDAIAVISDIAIVAQKALQHDFGSCSWSLLEFDA